MRSIVCASEMTTPRVPPSGAARLTMFMPMAPEAPGWFSTTTGRRRLSLSFGPISRALMSPAPPGGLGTMMRIVRDLASILAAERLHDLGKEHRSAAQRFLSGSEAPLTVEARGLWPAPFDRVGNAIRRGEIKPCLVDEALLVRDRIHVGAGIAA